MMQITQDESFSPGRVSSSVNAPPPSLAHKDSREKAFEKHLACHFIQQPKFYNATDCFHFHFFSWQTRLGGVSNFVSWMAVGWCRDMDKRLKRMNIAFEIKRIEQAGKKARNERPLEREKTGFVALIFNLAT
jgi:hypothetical protein